MTTITLPQYVRLRNGVPLGHRKSMVNMLSRSFGASTLSGFWRHWNPIWSYGLSRFVHSPVRRFLPGPVAIIVTFLVSGLIHDAVIMLLRGAPAMVFTPWFALIAIVVAATDLAGLRLDRLSFAVRAIGHGTVLALCFAVAFLISDAFGLWSGS